MGLGFYGRRCSRAIIETLLDKMIANGDLDDPFLRFMARLESTTPNAGNETVNLGPLFSCQGAVADALGGTMPLNTLFQQRQKNLISATSVAESSGWRFAGPAAPFRTGMLLLRAKRQATRNRCSEALRKEFAGNGIALTTYDGGFVRLSMPAIAWQPDELEQLRFAMNSAS
jgi:hypothetical protein